MSGSVYSSEAYSSSEQSSASDTDLGARKGYHPTFPDQDFDYGDDDPIIISPKDKKRYLDDLLGIRTAGVKRSGKTKQRLPWPKEIAAFIPASVDKRRRKKFPEDQEELVNSISNNNITTPRRFWLAVLEHFPPRFQAEEVLHQLCTIKPMQQPSETVLYKEVMENAEACRDAGAAALWRAQIKKFAPLPGEALLEAIRIYGSSAHGFGRLPPGISNALKEAGIYFLAVDRSKRIVPECWKAAADKAGITYAKVGSGSLKASAVASDHTRRNDDLHHKSCEDMKKTQERHQDLANLGSKVHDLGNILKDSRKELRGLKREFRALRDRVEPLEQNQRETGFQETWASYDNNWTQERHEMRRRLGLLEEKVDRRSKELDKSSSDEDVSFVTSRRPSHRSRQVIEDSSDDDEMVSAASRTPDNTKLSNHVGSSDNDMDSASSRDKEPVQESQKRGRVLAPSDFQARKKMKTMEAENDTIFVQPF
jgi:hypothetical protein